MSKYHILIKTYYELEAKNEEEAINQFESLTYEDLAKREVEDTDSILFDDNWDEVKL